LYAKAALASTLIPIAEIFDESGRSVSKPPVHLRRVFELLATLGIDSQKPAGDFRQAAHIPPEFFELGHWVDIFLAQSPSFFDIFDG
jgi:hypothetical protein